MAVAAAHKPNSTVQRHIYDHIVLGAIVIGLSAALTYAEVAGVPQLGNLWQASKTPAAPTPIEPVTPPAATTPKAAQPPAAAPAVVAPPAPVAPVVPTATTVSFVHMRAAKTTASPILTDLQAGTTVELIDDSNPSWQGVKYQGQTGYIFKSYLQYSQ